MEGQPISPLQRAAGGGARVRTYTDKTISGELDKGEVGKVKGHGARQRKSGSYFSQGRVTGALVKGEE